MRVIGVIHAKGTSDRVPGKNMQLLGGEPLVVRSVRKLMRVEEIDCVYVDTDSDEIAAAVEWTGCRLSRRDPTLATNDTDGNQLLVNFAEEIERLEADVYVQYACTSPFIEEESISHCLKHIGVPADLGSDIPCDSTILATLSCGYEWLSESKPLYDIDNVPNSNATSASVKETTGLYVVTSDALQRTNRRTGDKRRFIIGTDLEATDINTLADLELARLIAAGENAQERKRLNALMDVLTAEILCDIVGRNNCVSSATVSGPKVKAFGRARTLSICRIEDPSKHKRIYDALESYDWINDGDIIIAENKTALQYPYFGELNARLARRAGASGFITDGFTRDPDAVYQLGFPTWSKGHQPWDIKTTGKLESIGQPVNIEGLSISPGQLVFADECGIVAIPMDSEDKVIYEALDSVEREDEIKNEIASNTHASQIVRENGHF